MICSCGFVAPSGCTCGFADSESLQWSKVAGQAAQRRPSPRIDARADNILSCGASGLLAKIPARFLTRPEVRVYRSTAQSIGNDTATLISYDTEQIDTDGMFTASSDRFDINTPGFYVVYSSVRWTGDADGWRDISLLLNGQIELARDLGYVHGRAADFGSHVSTVYRFTATDFLQTRVHHTAGAALNVLAANGTTINSRNTMGAIFLGDL